VDPVHHRLAKIGLAASQQFGFALAGGYAVQAHGILQRPSEDVDLFTAWERREDFTEAVQAVATAYRAAGYDVEIEQQFETFARLKVVDPEHADEPQKVELAANWRAHPPIMMEIGPVLHAEDVAAGKMSALYTRAEPRDYLDVDATIASGRYTPDDLCELAAATDAGFDTSVLAQVFAMLERYPDRRFAAYGATPEQITSLRQRFADWRRSLMDKPA
jgi:hypothetical protein